MKIQTMEMRKRRGCVKGLKIPISSQIFSLHGNLGASSGQVQSGQAILSFKKELSPSGWYKEK